MSWQLLRCLTNRRRQRQKHLNAITAPDLRLSGGCSVKPTWPLLSNVPAEQICNTSFWKGKTTVPACYIEWPLALPSRCLCLGLRRSPKSMAENWRPSYPPPFSCFGSSGVKWPPWVRVGDISHVKPPSRDWTSLADTRRKVSKKTHCWFSHFISVSLPKEVTPLFYWSVILLY